MSVVRWEIETKDERIFSDFEAFWSLLGDFESVYIFYVSVGLCPPPRGRGIMKTLKYTEKISMVPVQG